MAPDPPSLEILTKLVNGMGVLCLLTHESDQRKAEESKICLVNQKLIDVSGYNASDLYGQMPEILVPNNLKEKHLEHRQRFLDFPRARAMGGANPQLMFQRKNGSLFRVQIELLPLSSDEGFFVAVLAWPFVDSE